MNLGNVLELFLFVVFVGAGAALGQKFVGGTGGLILGAAVGVLVRIGLGLLAGDWPPCACGNAEVSRFDLDQRTPDQSVWVCQQCRRSYELNGRDWIEVFADGARVPRLHQGYLGKWREYDTSPVRR
jgi:hypothetical protein